MEATPRSSPSLSLDDVLWPDPPTPTSLDFDLVDPNDLCSRRALKQQLDLVEADGHGFLTERAIPERFRDSASIPEEYSIDTAHLGRAIVFHHETYSRRLYGDGRRPPEKSGGGTDDDVKRLAEVLGGLGCAPIDVYRDKTEKEIEDVLKRAAEDDYSDRSCVIVAVLAHGDENELFAYDKKYDVGNLWKPFAKATRRNPTLAGKPKLFLIRACLGDLPDAGRFASKGTLDGVVRSRTKRIPMCPDLFVVHSSISGYPSESGSWFIQNLCDCIERFKGERDLVGLMTVVQHRAVHTETGDEKRIPYIESTLTKTFYLTPEAQRRTIGRGSASGRPTDAHEPSPSSSVADHRWIATAVAATVVAAFVVTKWAS